MTDTFSILELINAAEEDSNHALDITDDEAWSIVLQLSGDIRLLAYLVLVIGIRPADQEHILSEDLVFHGDGRCLLPLYQEPPPTASSLLHYGEAETPDP